MTFARDGGPVGVYGKVRGQADFVRIGAGTFCQAGVDQWFESALETLRTEGGRVPETPTGFLLAPKDCARAFIGVFAPSADAVGRAFPLVVFAEVPLATAAEQLPAMPALFRPFLDDAALLVALPPDSPAEVAARTDAMAATIPNLGGGRSLLSSLGDESADALVSALGGSRPALGYALRTFSSACDQAIKAGPHATSGVITVDAPTPGRSTRQFWLEIVTRKLRWRDAIPSLLWTETPRSRLLVTLGPPSNSALSFLANPRHRSTRFWPLKTDATAAIDQAMNVLTPEQRRRIEEPQSGLGDLMSAFA